MRVLIGFACVAVIFASGLVIFRDFSGYFETGKNENSKAEPLVQASSKSAAQEATTRQEGEPERRSDAAPVAIDQAQLDQAAKQTWVRSSEPLRKYLRESGSRFPVSVIDRVNFFNPLLIEARVMLNLVQIDFSSEELAKVKPQTLLEFLTRAVEITQLFNCMNHRQVLDMGTVVMNAFHTRESGAVPQILPAVVWNGQEILLDKGFITDKQLCESLPKREDLVIKPSTHPEERLLQLMVKQRPRGFGTGWTLPNGLIVTNNHVIDGSLRIYVVRRDREFREASVLVRDQFRDLAILKVDDIEFLPPAFEIATEDHDIGEQVFTVGYPWTSQIGNRLPEVQLTQGIISSLPDNGVQYQLSMAVQQGNSGGPLLTSRGNVTGIVVSKYVPATNPIDPPENVAQAIRSEHLRNILFDLTSQRRIESIQFEADSSVADVARQARESVLLVLSF